MNIHLGRKVILFLTCVAIITVALFQGFLTGDQFINGLTISFAFYVGGNSFEHYVKKD